MLVVVPETCVVRQRNLNDGCGIIFARKQPAQQRAPSLPNPRAGSDSGGSNYPAAGQAAAPIGVPMGLPRTLVVDAVLVWDTEQPSSPQKQQQQQVQQQGQQGQQQRRR